MKYTKKVISLMLILVLMLSIVPFGATESTEDPAAIEDVSDPSPLENPAPMEQQAPEEQPPAEQTPTLTEAPTPVETESPTEQPTITEQPTPPEEPTTAPTPEEPTQEPLPSPTVQAEIDDKAGWEHAPQYIDYSSYEIGLGNSFEVFLTDFYGGTGRYTYSYYIYNNNNVVVQKTGYTINSRYTYTPKALGKYYAVVYIKNDNGDIRTIKSDKRRVDVIEKLIPLYVQANVLTNNIVLGDAKHFKIESNGGNGSTPHLHTYYVYKNNKIIEKFSYKQSVKDGHYFSTEVVYTPKSPGKYMFSVFAKDAAGRTTLAYTDAFLVTGAALNLRASVNKIEKINEIATVVAEANGGSGTYQYAYYVYKDNAIIQKVWYTANAKFYYIPKSEGRYKVQVFVRDSLGAVKTEFTQEFYVTSPCLSADIRYIRKGADCFYCKTYAKGGVPPYKYAHYIYENEVLVEKLPYADGVVDIDSIDLYNDPDNYGYYYELKYTPKNPGFYKVIAFVKDATGKIKTSTTGSIDYVKNWLENVAPPQIESSIGLGNSINVKTYLRHGTGIYKYAYYIYKDGKILQKFPYTSNPTLVYRPTSIGTYQVKVFVKDDLSSGHSMSNTCIVKPLEPLEFYNVQLPEVSRPNEVIEAITSAGKGVEPYKYAYYIYHNNNIIKKTTYEENYPTYKFIPKDPGNYKVTAFIRDGTGKIILKTSNTCVVSNNPQPSNYQEMEIDAVAYNVTSNLMAFVQVHGGVEPYQSAYYVYKDGIRVRNVGYSNRGAYFYMVYNATESGTYKFIVFVKDKLGKIKRHTTNDIFFNLNDPPNITKLEFEDTNIFSGDTLRVNMKMENGYNAKIAFNVYNDGKLYFKTNFKPYQYQGYNEYSWCFRANHLGNYKVEAVVKTANGNIIKQMTTNSCSVFLVQPEP